MQAFKSMFRGAPSEEAPTSSAPAATANSDSTNDTAAAGGDAAAAGDDAFEEANPEDANPPIAASPEAPGKPVTAPVTASAKDPVVNRVLRDPTWDVGSREELLYKLGQQGGSSGAGASRSAAAKAKAVAATSAAATPSASNAECQQLRVQYEYGTEAVKKKEAIAPPSASDAANKEAIASPSASDLANKAAEDDVICPFFARESKELTVRGFTASEASALQGEPSFSLTSKTPLKLAAWSPDGAKLAVVDPAQGLLVVEFTESNESISHTLSSSATTVQQLQWSPKATYLVTQSPGKSDDAEPNAHIWKCSVGEGSYACEMSFHNPKFERDLEIFQWTADEQFCCQLLVDGKLQILAGSSISSPPLVVLPLDRAAQAFHFAPPVDLGACIACFMQDSRDAMQRVIAPADVVIFDLSKEVAVPSKRGLVPVEFGQQADLKWSPTGTAMLAHSQTDVDDSGQSYYGGSKLVLISSDCDYTLDLTEAKDSVVQAVSWSPTRDEFILIQGFQPAIATCWVWNPQQRKCTRLAVLLEKAHRNTIRWNSFGSMVLIAGFGNLAGEVDFFGRTDKKGLAKVSSCVASCAVASEWAPDGRHLMTATLAPRMRVDNGLFMWSALTGAQVGELLFDELLEVQWRPARPNCSRFSGVSIAEIEQSIAGSATRSGTGEGEKPKKAYVPPSARARAGDADGGSGSTGNRVAAMMKGDIPGGESIEAQLARHSNVSAAPVASTAPSSEPGTSAGPSRPSAGGGRSLDEAFGRQQETKDRTEGARTNAQLYGSKDRCPATGWQYRDPKGKVQGPFTLEQMTAWHGMGVFKPDLPMRCSPDDRFVPFKELFPHPMVPFHRAPKRPV